MSTAPVDAAVVGGGIIGLTSAWRAAEQGLSVTVVDPHPGRGASFAAAGMLAPVTEVEPGEEPLLALNLEAAAGYPQFIEALEEAAGVPAGYRRCGTLMVAPDAGAGALVEHVYRLHLDLGLRVTRLTAAECRTLEPGLAPRIRGGVLAPDDHEVDNRALLEALAAACDRAGVRRHEAAATGVTMSKGRVTGVETATGTVAAGAVVVAMGAHSGGLLGLPRDAGLPVRPVKGQLVHVGRTGEPVLFNHNLRTPDVYLVARGDGRAVVGATVEEQGFDVGVTTGAVRELLDAAYEVLPGLNEARFSGAIAGLRPALPDNMPAIGPGAVDGLIWATGHFRNGILLAPVTAAAVAGLLATGRLDDDLGAFAPARFAAEAVA